MICASAIDTLNVTSDLYCYTVTIGITEPNILNTSYSPNGIVDIDVNKNVTFSCSFDKNVKKNTYSKLISLIEETSNTTLETLDVLDETKVFLKNNTLTFRFQTTYQPYGKYVIKFDKGKSIIIILN